MLLDETATLANGMFCFRVVLQIQLDEPITGEVTEDGQA